MAAAVLAVPQRLSAVSRLDNHVRGRRYIQQDVRGKAAADHERADAVELKLRGVIRPGSNHGGGVEDFWRHSRDV